MKLINRFYDSCGHKMAITTTEIRISFAKGSSLEEQQQIEQWFLSIANQLEKVNQTLRGTLTENGIMMWNNSKKLGRWFSFGDKT